MTELVNVSKLNHNQDNNINQIDVEIPQNIDAEQALLGALLINNEIYDKINNILKPHHFYDPVHQIIF